MRQSFFIANRAIISTESVLEHRDCLCRFKLSNEHNRKTRPLIWYFSSATVKGADSYSWHTQICVCQAST